MKEQEGGSRLLGVDYGAQRIGVAVSEGRIAVPLTIVEHTTRDRDLDRVATLAREHAVAAVVVGLPLLEAGDEGEQARRTRRFGDALARRIDAPVRYHDERLSSFRAEQDTAGAPPPKRSRGRHLDDVAASVILQSFIDERPEGKDAPRPEHGGDGR